MDRGFSDRDGEGDGGAAGQGGEEGGGEEEREGEGMEVKDGQGDTEGQGAKGNKEGDVEEGLLDDVDAFSTTPLEKQSLSALQTERGQSTPEWTCGVDFFYGQSQTHLHPAILHTTVYNCISSFLNIVFMIQANL